MAGYKGRMVDGRLMLSGWLGCCSVTFHFVLHTQIVAASSASRLEHGMVLGIPSHGFWFSQLRSSFWVLWKYPYSSILLSLIVII